jgi:hypothetical protein
LNFHYGASSKQIRGRCPAEAFSLLLRVGGGR